MFEDLKPKSAEERGDDDPESMLDKTIILFYIVAALSAVMAVRVLMMLGGLETVTWAGLLFWLPATAAILSFVTARGLRSRSRWALVVGIAASVVLLLRFPIGTIFGVMFLIGLYRLHQGKVLVH